MIMSLYEERHKFTDYIVRGTWKGQRAECCFQVEQHEESRQVETLP